MKNKKIKIFLMGGIGNQLFQISRATSLRDEGYDIEVLLLRRFKFVAYKILKFTQHEDWIDVKALCKVARLPSREIKIFELLLLLITYIKRKLGLKNNFDEKYFYNNVFIKSKVFNGIDVGYFQSLEHVSIIGLNQVAQAIIDVLQLKPGYYSADFVAHVRGGDFAAYDRLDVGTARKIVDLSFDKGLILTIVSNDAKYVKKIFNNINNIKIVTGNSAKSDFIFLTRAKTLFLSISTFSFWAALCNLKLNKTDIFFNKDFSFSELLDEIHLIGRIK